MINHIPERSVLVVIAHDDPHDLAQELQRHPCTRLSIHGTPENLDALSEHPELEEVTLDKCECADLDALRGLTRLRQLSIAFGPLSSMDLDFCKDTLEFLQLARLKRLKDLSTLPPMPKLEHLTLSQLHGFAPPDFRNFPGLRFLSIWNTDWTTLKWLSHLPHLVDVHISQARVTDKGWEPLLELPQLRHLHGFRSVFGAAACKEFMRRRPEVRVDQGIPVDLEKHPEVKEYMDQLAKKEG